MGASREVLVRYLPDPYELDNAYIDGLRVVAVERFVMDVPDPDRPGPYIRRALREEFEVGLRAADSSGPEEAGCCA